MELNFTLKVLAAQLYPTLCDHMDCSPPGSSVHGIIQSRILEWGAISFSRGSSQTRYQTQVSCIAGKFFTIWATREALTFKGKKQILNILCAVPEISSIPMNYPLEIWSVVPLPFLKPAWTSASSRFIYCWSLAWKILSITLLACEMSAIVQ